MAYHYDQTDNSLVIDGFEQGIAESPHKGIANLQNVNVVSVPGEASVGFSTATITSLSFSNVAVTSAGTSTSTITFAPSSGLENYQAISFDASNIGGISAGTTVFWIANVTGTPVNGCTLYTDYAQTSLASITSSGTATFHTHNIAQPKYFSQSNLSARQSTAQLYFMVDSNGKVWSDKHTTTSNFWTFTGNDVSNGGNNEGHGNGLVYYVAQQGTTQTGYLFVFRNSQIDYAIDNAAFSWIYGWQPSTATSGNNSYLKTAVGVNNPHEAMVTPDNKVCYCDANYIGRFYQTSTGTAFDPTSLSTYTQDNTSLLPASEVAQCLTFLGASLLVGGNTNKIYPWDMFSSTYSVPIILLSENNVVKVVTVNTKAYVFTGNRGRIYVTNGSQAQLFKKIPDHISGTIEPYFTWGGACYQRNQLYFGCYATTNALATNAFYGGVWAIDLNTGILRLTNQLSYGTYDGFASALFAKTDTASASLPAGAGLLIGWVNAVVNGTPTTTSGGLDKSTSNPYTGSQASIESDIIPVGTFDLPRDFQRIEFKLMKPLVSGESISLKYRTDFSQSYTTIFTDSTVGDFSSSNAVNFKNAQWLQIQAVLNSTTSSPSYVRLKEIRIR